MKKAKGQLRPRWDLKSINPNKWYVILIYTIRDLSVIRLSFNDRKAARDWVSFRTRTVPTTTFLIKKGDYIIENNIPWTTHVKNMGPKKRVFFRLLFSGVGEKRQEAAIQRVIKLKGNTIKNHGKSKPKNTKDKG